MTMHIMIDLETLGTRPDAAIIQLGAVLFEPKSGGKILNNKAFNQYILVQDGSGSIDHSTLCFWLTEKSALKMGTALSTEARHLAEVLGAFIQWPEQELDLSWEAIEGVWAKPDVFDLPVLKSAFNRVGRDAPWDRRASRDAQTLFSLVGGAPEIDWTGFTHHDALDDAIGQAMQVQMALGKLT